MEDGVSVSLTAMFPSAFVLEIKCRIKKMTKYQKILLPVKTEIAKHKLNILEKIIDPYCQINVLTTAGCNFKRYNTV